jgi:hypothetical protein
MGGRGAAVAAISMAAVLTLGGCGSDAAAGGDDPSGAETSSGATETPGETPTETPKETPTEAPEPTVEPASGPELEVSGVRVNAPKGWKQTISSVVVDSALGSVDGQTSALLLSVAALGGEFLSPRQAERYFWSPGEKPPNFERQNPVLMDDVRAGYYTSRDRFDDIHSLTLWDDNHVVKVEVSFAHKVAEDRQQELLESVIASYSGPQG